METTKLGKWEISYRSREEFLELKREIWTEGNYYFERDDEITEANEVSKENKGNEEFVIIDVGAHIGLASLYWLGLYPEAKVWAIEANPLNLEVLRQNVMQNNLTDQVKIVGGAVIGNGKAMLTQIDFYYDEESEWLMSGGLLEGAWNGQERSQKVKVPAVKLGGIIEEIKKETNRQKIDLFKMDIEGAEMEVLEEMGMEKLRNVERLFLEFHPARQKEKRLQQWRKIMDLLQGAGLRSIELRSRKKGTLLSPAQAEKMVLHQELILIQAQREV